MRTRYFEISCDKCRATIIQYKEKSPSDKKLKADGITVINRWRHYCSDCTAQIRWAKQANKQIEKESIY